MIARRALFRLAGAAVALVLSGAAARVRPAPWKLHPGVHALQNPPSRKHWIHQ